MLRWTFVVPIVAASATWANYAQAQSMLDQDAVAFGTREAVSNMDLSPDGKLAVFVGAGPGRTTMVYIANIALGTNKPILYSKGSPESIQWCSFASNTRLVCRFTVIVPSEGSVANPGTLIPASRTISLNTDGTDIKPLGQQSTSSDLGIRQFDGSIIDWKPGTNNDILMTRLFVPEGSRGIPTNIRRTKSGVGVVKLNVETLAAETVEAPRENVFTWMSDGQGHVRMFGIEEFSSQTYATGRAKYLYRLPGSSDWKPLGDFADVKNFQPLIIDGAANLLYAVRKFEGRWALSRILLDDSASETVIAHDASFDIAHVTTIGESHRVIGFEYNGQDETTYFDPEYKSLASSLQTALPGHPDIKFVGESNDRQKLAIFAGRGNDPGRYYLFDKTKKSLGELIPARTNIAGRQFASVKLVSYPSSDGTVISGRLFLPPTKSEKSLPTVIFAGGDGGYIDVNGFEWFAQFLAARGYAVFEPRYRGYGGGDAWFDKMGFKGWQTSAQDISKAVRYVIDQGIADPTRIAIVGWSHGGYAAILAAEADPQMYKAIIAIAPITDLSSYKQDWSDYTAGNRIASAVGSAQFDGSPTRKASSLQAPLLLFHGTFDASERVTQSRSMRDAAQKAGKQVELVEFNGLDRDLEDSAARSTMLLKTGQLLERTIGR